MELEEKTGGKFNVLELRRFMFCFVLRFDVEVACCMKKEAIDVVHGGRCTLVNSLDCSWPASERGKESSEKHKAMVVSSPHSSFLFAFHRAFAVLSLLT